MRSEQRSAAGALLKCDLCGSSAWASGATVPGYIDGFSAETAECSRCHSQKAIGSSIPPDLYDAIYARGRSLEGYCRYYRFAEHVRRSSKPLHTLTQLEDCYWAVGRQIKTGRGVDSPRVVEIGCGLGYLTAALRGSNIEAYGVDISALAIQNATSMFGPWYTEVDHTFQVGSLPTQPDIIIALEIIEHLDSPMEFIKLMMTHLRDDGQLIVSTPNRSIWPDDAVWQTDPPPVHLHWISEDGLRLAGLEAGCSAEVVDFTPYNRWLRKERVSERVLTYGGSMLTDALMPMQPVNPKREWLLSTRIAPLLTSVRNRVFAKAPSEKRMSRSLVMVFRKVP